MIAQFEDGHVERITIGEPDCADYLRLLEWRRDTPGLTFECPDYHRLQLEHWVWTRIQALAPARVLDIGVYDRRDWMGPGYRTLGPADTACDVVGDILDPDAMGVAQWDAIVCTEVLEHCANPLLAMAHMHQALVPGGTLLITSPFLWPDHHTEDYPDYWRFTDQGWKLLCRAFRSVAVQPCKWTPSGACAYHLMRQAEGMGFHAQTLASTGYLVEAVR